MPRMRSYICLFLILCWFMPAPAAAADNPDQGEAAHQGSQPLRIGTRHAPPFSYQNDDGQWQGLSISLLDHIADELNLGYELTDFTTMAELLSAVQDGTIDGAVAAITISPARETVMDFSHPFHFTGFGIAVPYAETQSSWLIAVKALFSGDFLKVITSLSVVLLLIGIAIWLAERRRNPQFPAAPFSGIGSGFWWSAVTTTTVGYGDKSPITVPGRLIGLVWMFAALIMIASVTAQITSALTLSAFHQGIQGPDDLPQTRVGVVHATTAATYAHEEGLRHHTFESLTAALDALHSGEVGAVVHDHPLLTYRVRQRPPNQLMVLEGTFERQDYGIALPLGSGLRKDINTSLIDLVTSQQWIDMLQRYGLR